MIIVPRVLQNLREIFVQTGALHDLSFCEHERPRSSLIRIKKLTKLRVVEILAISHTHLEDNLKMKIKNKDQSRDLLLKFKLALQ